MIPGVQPNGKTHSRRAKDRQHVAGYSSRRRVKCRVRPHLWILVRRQGVISARGTTRELSDPADYVSAATRTDQRALYIRFDVIPGNRIAFIPAVFERPLLLCSVQQAQIINTGVHRGRPSGENKMWEERNSQNNYSASEGNCDFGGYGHTSHAERSRSGRAGQAQSARNKTASPPLPAPRLLDHVISIPTELQ